MLWPSFRVGSAKLGCRRKTRGFSGDWVFFFFSFRFLVFIYLFIIYIYIYIYIYNIFFFFLSFPGRYISTSIGLSQYVGRLLN